MPDDNPTPPHCVIDGCTAPRVAPCQYCDKHLHERFAEDPGPPPNLVTVTVEMPAPAATPDALDELERLASEYEAAMTNEDAPSRKAWVEAVVWAGEQLADAAKVAGARCRAAERDRDAVVKERDALRQTDWEAERDRHNLTLAEAALFALAKALGWDTRSLVSGELFGDGERLVGQLVAERDALRRDLVEARDLLWRLTRAVSSSPGSDAIFKEQFRLAKEELGVPSTFDEFCAMGLCTREALAAPPAPEQRK